jgi:hypothetical protein
MNQARNLIDLALYRFNNPSAIVSPYLTKLALKYITKGSPDIDIFTRCDFENFLELSSDIQAIEYADSVGMRIHHVPNLHAKIYLFPDEALVGSANCTNRGLALGKPGRENVEILASVSRCIVDPFISDLKESCSRIQTEDINSLSEQLKLSEKINENTSGHQIDNLLAHCVIPEWCSYRKYEQVMCEELAGLPASIYRDLRREIDLLELRPTYGSKTAFKKEIRQALLSYRTNKALVVSFKRLGEQMLRERALSKGISEEYTERVIFWCRWIASDESDC